MDDAVIGANFWEAHVSFSLFLHAGPYLTGHSCIKHHYFKAEAYRIEPLSTKSCLSVDGEAFPRACVGRVEGDARNKVNIVHQISQECD